MTKYTFLLPAYKGRFLDEMLQSIQNQTYTDFKVIISDDCSPEDLYSICVPYLNDSRFKYRRNEKNMGGKDLVSHWNLIVNMCDTEYFILAGDDDVYDSHFIEDINHLVSRYTQVDLFRSRVRTINTMGETLLIEEPSDEYEKPLKAMYSHFLMTRIHCIGNYVFRASAVRQMNGFTDFPLAWFSDDATVLNCMHKGVCNNKNVGFAFRKSNINISNDKQVTVETARKKIQATKCFYYWSLSFMERQTAPTTLYEHNLHSSLLDMMRNRIKWQLYYYYSYVKVSDKLKLLRWLRNNGLDCSSKIQYLKSLVRACFN